MSLTQTAVLALSGKEILRQVSEKLEESKRAADQMIESLKSDLTSLRKSLDRTNAAATELSKPQHATSVNEQAEMIDLLNKRLFTISPMCAQAMSVVASITDVNTQQGPSPMPDPSASSGHVSKDGRIRELSVLLSLNQAICNTGAATMELCCNQSHTGHNDLIGPLTELQTLCFRAGEFASSEMITNAVEDSKQVTKLAFETLSKPRVARSEVLISARGDDIVAAEPSQEAVALVQAVDGWMDNMEIHSQDPPDYTSTREGLTAVDFPPEAPSTVGWDDAETIHPDEPVAEIGLSRLVDDSRFPGLTVRTAIIQLQEANVLPHHALRLATKQPQFPWTDAIGQGLLGNGLIKAASLGRVDLVPLLLIFGADPNYKTTGDAGSQCALYVAIKINKPQIVQMLLEAGAKVDFIFMPADYRAEMTPRDVNSFYDLDARYVFRLIRPSSPLTWAIAKGYDTTAEILISHFAELPQNRRPDLSGSLLLAVWKDNPALVGGLLDADASLIRSYQSGPEVSSTVHHACALGHLSVIQALIDHPASRDVFRTDMYSTFSLYHRSFQSIVDNIYRPEPPHDGNALHVATQAVYPWLFHPAHRPQPFRYVAVVKLLIEDDLVDINAMDRRANTAIHIATKAALSWHGLPAHQKTLHEHTGPPSLTHTIQVLVSAGANVNHTNGAGLTPLMMIAKAPTASLWRPSTTDRYGYIRAVEALLDGGADCRIVDDETGLTPAALFERKAGGKSSLFKSVSSTAKGLKEVAEMVRAMETLQRQDGWDDRNSHDKRH